MGDVASAVEILDAEVVAEHEGTTTDPKIATRLEWARRMRRFVEFFEAHPELELPNDWSLGEFDTRYVVITQAPDDVQRVALQRWARVLRKAEKDYTSAHFSLVGRPFEDGPLINVLANRESVCRARVVGKETVRRAKKTEYEEVEVDKVEWECVPLMAERPEIDGPAPAGDPIYVTAERG
jgi:hypothetical protein